MVQGISFGKKFLMFIVIFIFYLIMSVYVLVPVIHLFQNHTLATSSQLESAAESLNLYSEPLRCYELLKEPNILKGWFVGAIALAAVIVVLGYAIKEGSTNQDGVNYLKDDGTHGTANWLTGKEAKKVLDIGTGNGVLLGLYKDREMVTLPSETFFNKNIAVFGSSGSMKSRAFVRPNIMQLVALEESMVITDPKGEIYHSMAEYLRDNGYTVKAFNLVNMDKSDRWNPLREIRDDIDAQTFVEVVIANTSSSRTGDQFWERGEQNLLKALILYVISQYPPNDVTLETVYSLLSAEDAKKIEELFNQLPHGHPAKAPYNIYAQANETVRTGVVIGLGTRLNMFQNMLVKKLTAGNDLDLTLPAKRKCAYFCISSDMDSTFDFLSGLFFSFLFISLVRYADNRGGTGKKQVFFILDEFPNIGAIPDFTKKISTMRSRGMHSWVIFQNIAQLKSRYPYDSWQEIIGNCDTRLFLGCTDIMTAEFVCDLLGESTVQSMSRMKRAGLEGAFDFGRISKSTQRRSLLNPDEILRLDSLDAIVILRGQKPMKVNKMDYTRHREAKKLRDRAISTYSKEWSKDIVVDDMFNKLSEVSVDGDMEKGEPTETKKKKVKKKKRKPRKRRWNKKDKQLDSTETDNAVSQETVAELKGPIKDAEIEVDKKVNPVDLPNELPVWNVLDEDEGQLTMPDPININFDTNNMGMDKAQNVKGSDKNGIKPENGIKGPSVNVGDVPNRHKMGLGEEKGADRGKPLGGGAKAVKGAIATAGDQAVQKGVVDATDAESEILTNLFKKTQRRRKGK